MLTYLLYSHTYSIATRIPPGPSKNDRYGHSDSNALIDIEFGEFRKKLKNLEFRQNSIFWESLGVIWIDSISFGVVPPLSFFLFFEFLNSGLEGPCVGSPCVLFGSIPCHLKWFRHFRFFHFFNS